MSTQADIDRVLAEYDPGDGDPGLADLMRDRLRAAAVDPDAVTVTAILVTGAEAMTLPSPETVLRLSAPSLNRPPIVSIGEPAILAAPGGAGKSYRALSLMAQATRAGEADRDVFSTQSDAWASALGFSLRRGPQLYVSYEDSCGRVGDRLERIGAPRETVNHLHIWGDPPALFDPTTSSGGGAIPSAAFVELERVIRDVRPALVVIDPVSAMMGACTLNDPTAARSAMRALARLSTETGAGVLCLAHDTKAARNEARAGGSPGAGAVAGSGQWFDSSRSVLYLHRQADGGISLDCLKANHGRAGWSQPLHEVGTGAGETYAGFEYGGEPIDAYATQNGKTNHEKQTDDDKTPHSFGRAVGV